jgi:hypothetical protein
MTYGEAENAHVMRRERLLLEGLVGAAGSVATCPRTRR